MSMFANSNRLGILTQNPVDAAEMHCTLAAQHNVDTSGL